MDVWFVFFPISDVFFAFIDLFRPKEIIRFSELKASTLNLMMNL